MKNIYLVACCLFFSLKLLAAPYLYVTCQNSNSVCVIDIGKEPSVLVDTITSDLINRPSSLAIFPNGKKAYVVNEQILSDEILNLAQIDIANNNQVQGPLLDLGDLGTSRSIISGPYIITISPNGRYAFIPDRRSNIYVIDLASYTLKKTISVSGSPTQTAFSLDSHYAYVTNSDDTSVTIIDVSTLEPLPFTIPVGSGPAGIAVSSDGKYAYVVNSDDPSFSIIDLTTNSQIPGSPFTLPGAGSPQFVSITPDGTKIYITSKGSFLSPSKVYAISIKDQIGAAVADPLSTFNFALGIVCSSDGKKVYVANSGSNTISVIDTLTDTVTSTILVDDKPTWLGITPTFTLAELLKNTRFSRVAIQKGNL